MIRNYLLVAWKVLQRRKFFTYVSLFGITFTIVVLLVVTALLDHIFAPHYPEANLGRTFGVYAVVQQGDESKRTGFAGYTLLDRALRPLENVEETAIIQTQNKVASYQEDGRKVELYIKRTDDAFWRIMTFDFLEGGPFSASDYTQARPVAVINQSTADEIFGSRSALGQPIDVDNQRFRVVGVVRDVPFLRVLPYADVWVPLTTSRGEQWREGLGGSLLGIVLAHDRSDFPRLKREFAGRVAQLEIPDKQFKTVQSELRTLFEFVALDMFEIGDTSRLRMVIAVLALMFMALPAINLINLNLSRIMERLSEIGVRKAFGATSPTHEVNNSVGAISSMLESHRTLDESERIRQIFRISSERLRNLSSFVNDYADLVRIPPPDLRLADLNEVVADVLSLYGASEEIVLRHDLADDLPVVRFDRNQIEQALINILKNAFEAIGTAGGNVSVRTSVQRDSLLLEVTDTGPGVERSELLFTPFYSTRTDGRGLGLTVVAQILENHGFGFSLENAPETGARFTIKFPLP